ncbi:MAG: hypothetical protein QM651_02420 [Rhodoblastus sp.]
MFSSSSARPAEGIQPFGMMRALQDMQEGVSVGIDLQQAATEASLNRFVLAISSGAGDWTDRRNRAALLFYLVTGGDPNPVKPALALLPKDTPDRKVIERAFASAEAAQGDGNASLNSIDPRDASPEVAGAVALAQGVSLGRQDRLAAAARLRDARLLAPGGLIEEMSLRQEIRLLRGVSDIRNLESLVARYFSLFARSIHSRRVLSDFVEIGEKTWKERERENREVVVNALAAMPDNPRHEAGIRLARSLFVLGDRKGALGLIEASCGDLNERAKDGARCAFYRSLATVYDSIERRDALQSTAHLETVDRLIGHCAGVLLDSERGAAVGVAGSDIPAIGGESGSGVAERSQALIDEAERLIARMR